MDYLHRIPFSLYQKRASLFVTGPPPVFHFPHTLTPAPAPDLRPLTCAVTPPCALPSPELAALPAAARPGPSVYRLRLGYPPPAPRGRPADSRAAPTRDAALRARRPAAGIQGGQAGRHGVPGQTA